MKTEVDRIKKMRTACLIADWDPKPDFKFVRSHRTGSQEVCS